MPIGAPALQIGLSLMGRPIVPTHVETAEPFRGQFLTGFLPSGTRLPSINQLSEAMTFAKFDGSASDGHARRGRHQLEPISAQIVDAGRRRTKLGVGFDTKGDLSNAQAFVILTPYCEVDGFRVRVPVQFLSLGVAEQNMMRFAVGIGLAGCRPFVHTA